jgi:hypothetical protein
MHHHDQEDTGIGVEVAGQPMHISFGGGVILHCANHCDHGCAMPVPEGQHWMTYAVENGWVLQLWRAPGEDPNHERHTLAYCDPACAYAGLRSKMLEAADPEWRRLIRGIEIENPV